MSFSEKLKQELLKNNYQQACCRMAISSAFIRGAGSIVVKNGKVGFEITTENKQANDKMRAILETVFGATVQSYFVDDKLTKKQKSVISCIDDNSLNILVELGILDISGGDLKVTLSIDKYLIENDCCKKAYVVGAFIGSGSITIPSIDSKTKTSYHLEFVFSQYQSAQSFAELLSSLEFLPRLIKRKENYVVYFKGVEEISDILAFMGANKCYLELQDVIIRKDIKNDTNRIVNCEMGNLNKQIEASLKQVNNIKLIDEMVGLDKLAPMLKKVADYRLENPEATLQEMAAELGETKSCINHRLRKINEIAESLK